MNNKCSVQKLRLVCFIYSKLWAPIKLVLRSGTRGQNKNPPFIYKWARPQICIFFLMEKQDIKKGKACYLCFTKTGRQTPRLLRWVKCEELNREKRIKHKEKLRIWVLFQVWTRGTHLSHLPVWKQIYKSWMILARKTKKKEETKGCHSGADGRERWREDR